MSLAPPSTLLSAGPILEDIDEEGPVVDMQYLIPRLPANLDQPIMRGLLSIRNPKSQVSPLVLKSLLTRKK
jgi:hypothetical protein